MNLKQLRDAIDALVEKQGVEVLDEPVYHLNPYNAATRNEVEQITIDPLWGYVEID